MIIGSLPVFDLGEVNCYLPSRMILSGKKAVREYQVTSYRNELPSVFYLGFMAYIIGRIHVYFSW